MIRPKDLTDEAIISEIESLRLDLRVKRSRLVALQRERIRRQTPARRPAPSRVKTLPGLAPVAAPSPRRRV